jgi:methylenetetrahydrofolate reductase (NADPH)
VPDGFGHANELATFIRSRFDYCIGGASYPEKHPEAASFEDDLRHLKGKVDAGVEFLLTQLFFDNADYWSLVERARAAGIRVPITPGIMPIVSAANLRHILTLSPGAKQPDELVSELDTVGDDADAALDVGVRWATRQCRELLEGGAPGIHFYTLNRSPATRRVHAALAAR